MKKLWISGLILGVLSLPARAQYNDSLGFTHNNPMSATIGTYLHGQSNMFFARQQLNRAMLAGGGRRQPTSGQTQYARGQKLIKRGRATLQFATRPFPIDKYMAGVWSGGGDFAVRQRNYSEWLAQKALWARESKARGAKTGDMAHGQALAFVMGAEAYTGKRINNAGFAAKVASLRRTYIGDPTYQGWSATQKQQHLEEALLSATYALFLRENGQTAKAREIAGSFLDSKWTTDHKGVSDIDDAIANLAPYTTKTATRLAARPLIATGKPVPRPVAASSASPNNSKAAPRPMSFEQARALTNFKRVAPALAPALLAQAQSDPGKRGRIESSMTGLLQGIRTDLDKTSKATLGVDNVARSFVSLTSVLYQVATVPAGRAVGQGEPPITLAQIQALQRQMAVVIASAPGFKNYSDRDKQATAEGYLLLPAIIAVTYNDAVGRGDSAGQNAAKKAAREGLQKFFGVAPEKMRFTDTGLQIG